MSNLTRGKKKNAPKKVGKEVGRTRTGKKDGLESSEKGIHWRVMGKYRSKVGEKGGEGSDEFLEKKTSRRQKREKTGGKKKERMREEANKSRLAIMKKR